MFNQSTLVLGYLLLYGYDVTGKSYQVRLVGMALGCLLYTSRNPISFIKTRIKKPNSIYNKLQKMGHDFTTENIQTYLNDLRCV